MTWAVHEKGKVREWPEATVRRKLQDGSLTGIELAREPGSKDWRPLHSTDLFKEVWPHTGDSATAAMSRVRASLVSHATVFAIVIGGFSIATGSVPSWSVWWAVGLAIHTFYSLSAIRKAKAQAVDSQREHERAAPLKRLSDSEVQRAIDELITAGWTGDANALRATASELENRRSLVDDSANAASRMTLTAELEQVRADSALADPATQEMLGDQQAAIESRLAFLDDVQRLAVRLRAQERTLLHQIESLRLGQLQSSDRDVAGDLEASVTRLRRELDAESEVTDALARARQAQRQ